MGIPLGIPSSPLFRGGGGFKVPGLEALCNFWQGFVCVIIGRVCVRVVATDRAQKAFLPGIHGEFARNLSREIIERNFCILCAPLKKRQCTYANVSRQEDITSTTRSPEN